MEATRTQDTRLHMELGAHLLHVRCPVGAGEDSYRQVLTVLEDITPVVQALPPAAAVADLAGAVRYFGLTPYGLAQRIQLRVAALIGISVQIGAASTWSLAAMASARTGPDGILLIADHPETISSFLDPLPVAALYGVGPQQAATLTRFGLHTIGALAATPLATVQRILGGRAGRTLHERARGIDPRPVIPTGLPSHVTEQRLLDHDTLDPDRLRTELLDAAVAAGDRLRRRHQVARSITLGVAFADGSRIERTRTLREPTAHTADLRTVAFAVFDSLGLQRARVRGLTLRTEQLTAGAPQQITLDHGRENRLLLEPVVDRLNKRFGQHAVVPARLAFRHSA
jgi:DNA polymerase-4